MRYFPNIIFSSYQKRTIAFLIDNICIYAISYFLSHILSSFINSLFVILLIRMFLVFCGNILIFSFLQSSKLQASFAEFLLGIKIVDKNGERIGFWRASYRRLILVFCPWGILLFFFSPNKQCLHDYLSDTLVINTTEKLRKLNVPLRKIRISLFLIYFLLYFIVPFLGLFFLYRIMLV